MNTVTANITISSPEVTATVNTSCQTVQATIAPVVQNVTATIEQLGTVLVPPTVMQRIVALENLKPIEISQDVVAGDLETVTMPEGNPNQIGMVQQIDGTDGNKVYYPNFTTTPDGRSAIFYSVTTQNNCKIILWPRE